MRSLRTILMVCAVAAPGFILHAQENHGRAWEDIETSRLMWAQSSNSAGILFDAPADHNKLDTGYSHEAGDYRLMQSGSGVGEFHFHTYGFKKISKIQLWGSFRYENVSESGASFNTMLVNPYDERFLYSAADSIPGQWKKQSYDMQFKASMPVGKRLAAGIHVLYTDRIAASQIDPRAESYNYSLELKPALTWVSGIGKIGLSGTYSNTFERSTPSISNTQEIQKVYLMRGLGNWVGDQIGGSGLSTMYFRCNTWGGALQYALDSPTRILAELSYCSDNTIITESATQPKPHGSTIRQNLCALGSATWGESVRHSIKLNANVVNTAGTESTSVWNKESGRWETVHTAGQVKLFTLETTVGWEAMVLDGESYTWRFNAEAGWEQKEDSYALPYSVFRYGNVMAKAGAGRNIIIGKASLLTSARLSYSKNVYGDYSYSGHRSGTAPVSQLYPHNLSILSSDRLLAGLDLEYAVPVHSGVNLAFYACGAYLVARPILRNRWSASGGIKLYF